MPSLELWKVSVSGAFYCCMYNSVFNVLLFVYLLKK